jgi:hypothetical protein
VKYLHKIVSLCREKSLNCFYVHGPLADPRCSRSAAYFSRSDALIEDSGIRVVRGTPLCMKTEEVGNTLDHVRPNKKAEFTRRYFQAMAIELDASRHETAR